MNILAYRKGGLGILHIITLMLGIFMISIGFLTTFVLIIFGGLISIVSIFGFVKYCKTPKEAIKLISGDTIEITGRASCNISEITAVTYKQARAKGIYYKWGTVIIATYHGKYKVEYLADCKDVAEEIAALKGDGEKAKKRYF